MTVTTIPRGSETEYAAEFTTRRTSDNAQIRDTVAEIIAEVRRNGFEAVERFSQQLDKVRPREISLSELKILADQCEPELVKTLRRAADNIREYQSKLIPESRYWNVENGRLGQIIRPLNRVGLYVPGGTAAYPSSVLMCAVPAKCAGVPEVVVATPPGQNLSPAVAAAALVAGVDRVFAMGGAQAIAALALGAGVVPRCDKIVGPGNSYVAEAKRQLFGEVDIDMIAGPSEIFVAADSTANPVWCAADLLSQAEHDVQAAALFATFDADLANAVARELERQVALLPRADIAHASLENYGAVLLCEDMDSVLELANAIAPEHLELAAAKPRKLAEKVRNAGAVFAGHFTPEPIGDYFAGPSHVLPTNGTAKSFSPLSVDSFLKRTSYIEYSGDGLNNVAADVTRFARAEGFEAHARSIEARNNK
ncbi:MAG: histidinol dehydrogenase [Oscillospiraceae bacterium]|jgi:histidinol dehydrogenase|nr:histidinol dehydrogenase [Oscillospiraceae bacterium]